MFTFAPVYPVFLLTLSITKLLGGERGYGSDADLPGSKEYDERQHVGIRNNLIRVDGCNGDQGC